MIPVCSEKDDKKCRPTSQQYEYSGPQQDKLDCSTHEVSYAWAPFAGCPYYRYCSEAIYMGSSLSEALVHKPNHFHDPVRVNLEVKAPQRWFCLIFNPEAEIS